MSQAGRAPSKQPSRTALGHQQIRFPHLHQALLTVLACVGPWQKSPFSAPLRLNSGPDQEPELHLLRCLRARGAPPSPPLRPARAEACAAMLWSPPGSEFGSYLASAPPADASPLRLRPIPQPASVASPNHQLPQWGLFGVPAYSMVSRRARTKRVTGQSGAIRGERRREPPSRF